MLIAKSFFFLLVLGLLGVSVCSRIRFGILCLWWLVLYIILIGLGIPRLNIILGGVYERVSDEISTEVSKFIKVNFLSHCWWAQFNPSRVWTEQRADEGGIHPFCFLPVYFRWDIGLLLLLNWDLYHWPLWLLDLQTWTEIIPMAFRNLLSHRQQTGTFQFP